MDKFDIVDTVITSIASFRLGIYSTLWSWLNSFIVYCTILNMKSLSCRDAGVDCDYVCQAESDYELFTKGQKHAFNAHGIKKQDFIPAFNEKMRSLIRET